MHECDKSDFLNGLKQDITEMKKDIKSLLQFKWFIMGGAGAIGALFSFILSVIK